MSSASTLLMEGLALAIQNANEHDDRDDQAKEILQRINSQKGERELDLSVCNLTSVPLDAIRTYYGDPAGDLDLSHNLIQFLSPWFVRCMVNLTKLDLSTNELQKLPDDFGSLRKLIYLDLHLNKLETLPLSMGKLNQLQYLNISDNPFKPPLSNFLDVETVRQQSETYKINVAHPIVQFLAEMARKTAADASGDAAPSAERKRSVTFGDILLDGDNDMDDEYKSRVQSKSKGRSSKLKPALRAPSGVSSLSGIKVPKRERAVLKGLGCVTGLIILTPFIIAMMVDYSYFDRFARDSASCSLSCGCRSVITSFLELFYEIHHALSTCVTCFAGLKIPLMVKTPPPEEPGFVTVLINTIRQMVYVVAGIFVTLDPV